MKEMGGELHRCSESQREDSRMRGWQGDIRGCKREVGRRVWNIERVSGGCLGVWGSK